MKLAVVAVCALMFGGCAEILGLEEGKPLDVGAGGSGGSGGGSGGGGGEGGGNGGCPPRTVPATCEAPNLEASDNCLGGGCVDGQCQPLQLASSMDANYPFGIAVADGYVIWGSGKEVVVRSPNGSITKIADNKTVARVAKQGDYVFWTEFDGPYLKRAKLPDGAFEILDEFGAAGSLGKLTVDAKRAYWTTEGDGASTPATVRSTPLDAVATEAINIVPPHTVLAESVHFVGIAVDETHVYWTERNGGLVRRKTLAAMGDGMPGDVVADDAYGAVDLALDATYVYWADDVESVWRAPKGGGVAREVVGKSGEGSVPKTLVVDDTHAYWTLGGLGQVHRAPKDGSQGGQVDVMAAGQDGPLALAQDCVALYWTNNESHMVMMLAK